MSAVRSRRCSSAAGAQFAEGPGQVNRFYSSQTGRFSSIEPEHFSVGSSRHPQFRGDLHCFFRCIPVEQLQRRIVVKVCRGARLTDLVLLTKRDLWRRLVKKWAECP